MQIPQFMTRALIKLHAKQTDVYYHLPGYMLRFWIFGSRSHERNNDNPNWLASCHVAPQEGWLHRVISRHIAIRAHTILRSDTDRHLHDHPSWSLSIVLDGGYWEVTAKNLAPQDAWVWEGLEKFIRAGQAVASEELRARAAELGIYWRGPGAVVFRSAKAAHRLILPPGTITRSIFILGRKTNRWGFYTAQGKVHWKDYLANHAATQRRREEELVD
jgi:hypothetical protein